jgi:Flp pilus assembly protein TadD
VNFAKVLSALARQNEAEWHFREALRLDSDNLDAHRGLGNLLRGQKRVEEALSCFSELVRLRPDDPDLHAICGNVLQDMGRLHEAELRYREACHLKPDYPVVFNNLGNLLGALGRLGEAEAHFRHALSLKPDFPEACNNLANLLLHCRRASEAETFCREALRLRPEYALAHNSLANALMEYDDYQAAEFHYREAVRLKPDYAEAYNNLGSLLGRLCKLDDSMAFFREAVKLQPDFHEAHANLGMTLLGVGEFEEGWRTYDTHRKIEGLQDLKGPRWEGEVLDGRVLLVYAEQGYGDVIQFSRFVPLIASRARVVFEVPRELLGLLADLPGVDQMVARGDPLPPYDAHCALLSLPRWLGITVERVLGDLPYVSAAPQKRQNWRDRVGELSGLRIGLAWAGNPPLASDRRRSISLDKFSRLAEVSGVSFVSLQKGVAAEQTLSPPAGMVVHDWTADLHDFADTAALVSELDLVIAVDTSVVHLAGALGHPVWLLNRFDSCWRWQIDSERSPWYKTLRQFKQPKPGDWDSVFSQVKAALESASRKVLDPLRMR